MRKNPLVSSSIPRGSSRCLALEDGRVVIVLPMNDGRIGNRRGGIGLNRVHLHVVVCGQGPELSEMFHIDRRAFLRIGSLGVFGFLPLGEALRLRAENPAKTRGKVAPKDISVIRFMLAG